MAKKNGIVKVITKPITKEEKLVRIYYGIFALFIGFLVMPFVTFFGSLVFVAVIFYSSIYVRRIFKRLGWI